MIAEYVNTAVQYVVSTSPDVRNACKMYIYTIRLLARFCTVYCNSQAINCRQHCITMRRHSQWRHLPLPSCHMHDIGIRSVSSTYSEWSVNEIMRLPTIYTVSRVEFTCYRMLIVISSDRSVWDCGWPGMARHQRRTCVYLVCRLTVLSAYLAHASDRHK